MSLLKLPGCLELEATRRVSQGAWARVRCKGCSYTGIGLQVTTALQSNYYLRGNA